MIVRYLFFFLLVVLSSGCTKRDLNLPEPSSMPLPVKVQPQHSDCGVQFYNKMSLFEIAGIAGEMHLNCGYNKMKISELARELFK